MMSPRIQKLLLKYGFDSAPLWMNSLMSGLRLESKVIEHEP